MPQILAQSIISYNDQSDLIFWELFTMSGDESAYSHYYDDIHEEEDEVLYPPSEDNEPRRIPNLPNFMAIGPVLAEVERVPPTPYETDDTAEKQRRTINVAVEEDVIDVDEIDYDGVELVHNAEDPYNIIADDNSEAAGDNVPDVEIVSHNRVDIGPELDADVAIIVDDTNNAAIRRCDMIAVRTRCWQATIIDGSQFYKHKSLRPPPANAVALQTVFARVVRVLVTRRQIEEFKRGSNNVYIQLVRPRLDPFWLDLKRQLYAQTMLLYAEHGEKRLQTFFLPDICQKFADGNVMTFKDYYSLLPGGKLELSFFEIDVYTVMTLTN
jgi:hypothetical protein